MIFLQVNEKLQKLVTNGQNATQAELMELCIYLFFNDYVTSFIGYGRRTQCSSFKVARSAGWNTAR